MAPSSSLSLAQFEDLIRDLDSDGDGSINYSGLGAGPGGASSCSSLTVLCLHPLTEFAALMTKTASYSDF
jgi:hypothetical protein